MISSTSNHDSGIVTRSRRTPLTGVGPPTRSFLYVDDMVRGAPGRRADDVDNPLNLGSDEEV
jgi:hypothetical protein